MRDEGMPVHAGRLAAILHPRWPDMLVPRSQIEQTAEGASTLVLVFEAPSIELGSQASGPAYVVRQRRASGRVSCLRSSPCSNTTNQNKPRSTVLRPCCVERLEGVCKPLISLVAARNVLQHETADGTKAEIVRNPYFTSFKYWRSQQKRQ
jgi:hypothetical protein